MKYAGDDLEKWDQHVAASLPKWQRDDLRIMYRYYQECGMGMTMHDLVEQERLLGSEPRPFSEYVGERSRQAACACYA